MTRRQQIIGLLSKQSMTLRELTVLFHADSKDILMQLDNISKSKKLRMQPSQCKNCDFVFKEREKRKRPNKCPKCKGGKITEPMFLISK